MIWRNGWVNLKELSKLRSITVKCHPSVAEKLREGKIKSLTKIQFKNLVKLASC